MKKNDENIEVINSADCIDIIEDKPKKNNSDRDFKSFMDKLDPPKKMPTVTYSIPNVDIESVQVSQEAVNSVLELHKEYNKKYGIDFGFDTADVARMFQSIVSPEKKKVMELYLSEAFDRFRLVVYQRLMFGIFQLVQDLTSPAYLSENVETKAILLEKLFLYMTNIEEMYSRIRNPHAEEELSKIAQDKASGVGSYDFTDPKVQEVIQRLNNTILTEKG